MKGGNKNIHNHPKANTNGFDKNPENINKKGLNRKLISSVNEEFEMLGIEEPTKAQIKSCYLRLLNHTIEELEEIVQQKEQPALVRIVAKNILSGKGFDIIEKILDRGIGKAEQQIDHNINSEKQIDLKITE